jgi:hypothetical protein
VSPDRAYPAQLTTTSKLPVPKWAAAASKAALTDSGEVTSSASLRMRGLESGR